MLSADLEIHECKPICPRGKEGTRDYVTGSLCIAIKDHNSPKRLAGESSQKIASLYMQAVSGVMVAPEELHKSLEFGIHLVRITLTRHCSQRFRESIKEALDNIKYTGPFNYLSIPISSKYYYIFSKAHSKRCFKNSIGTQRKTLLVNVSVSRHQ